MSSPKDLQRDGDWNVRGEGQDASHGNYKKEAPRKRRDKAADNYDDDDDAPQYSNKKKRKKASSSADDNDDNSQNENDDNDDDLVCLECRKEFKTKPGLDYHIRQSVCRRQPKQPIQKQKQEPKSSPSEHKHQQHGVDVDDDDDNISNDADDDEEGETPLMRRRLARRRGRGGIHKKASEEFDGDDDDDENHSRPKQDMTFICRHCHKQFSNKFGMKYHVDKLVCRPESPKNYKNKPKKKMKKGASVASKRQKKSPTSPPAKEDDDDDPTGSNKNNSNDNERVCPYCQKVFTSVLGKDYHVNHFVCRPELKPPPTPKTPPPVASRNSRRHRHPNDNDGDSNNNLSDDARNCSSEDDLASTTKDKKHLSLQTTKSGRTVRRRFEKMAYSSSSSSSNSSDDDGDDDSRRSSSELNHKQQQQEDVISDNEKETDEEEANDKGIKALVKAPQNQRRKRARGRRHQHGEEADNISAPDASTDDDESCKDEESSSVNKRKRRRRKKRKKGSDSVVSVEDRTTCPYCDKVFKSAHALDYHLDNFVCRPEIRPNGPAQKGRRKSNSSGRQFQKIRGKLQDRTCPKCERVFTSVLGMQYHREKRVCEVDAAKMQAKLNPNFRLLPGQKFVTPYGIVQVVKDDRGPGPVAQLPEGVDKITRLWKSAKIKRQDQIGAFYQSATASSLVKRRLLSDLYNKGVVTAATVERVYNVSPWASDPARFVMPLERPDPAAPEESYPDRIVECEFIVDQREHVVMFTDSTQVELKAATTCVPGSRLFIRRRELTESYDKDDCPYACFRCGQLFMSRPGAIYHLRAAICANRMEAAKESNLSRLRAIEGRAEYLEKVAKSSSSNKNPSSSCSISKKKRSQIENMPMYPQVWVSLGFKLLPKSEATNKERRISAFKPAKKEAEAGNAESDAESNASATSCSRPKTKAKVVAAVDPTKHPRFILEQLERQLRYEESRAIGPMYPGVFHALGYEVYNPTGKASVMEKQWERQRKAAQRKKEAKKKMERKSLLRETMRLAKKKESDKVKRRRQLQKRREANKSLMSAAAIVDMRVLVNEVDGGRYPSFKRYHGEHDQTCSVCKTDTGSLLYCNYCRHSVHFTCVLLKYAVQEPEPCDGFMCRRCISNVLHRRMRAEKRRVEKYGTVPRNAVAVSSKLNLLEGVVDGREYECLEAQGQRVSDLTVLMKDAQNRLTIGLATSSLNALRLSMIDPTRESERTGTT